MATIRNGRISTTTHYKDVKAIPELGLPALVRTYSGGAPSISSDSDTSSTNETINPAEPCFITKGHSYALKMAHFVNASQHDAAQEGDVVCHICSLNQKNHSDSGAGTLSKKAWDCRIKFQFDLCLQYRSS